MKKGPEKVIILTGPSGAGKSTLSGHLARRGWQVLDADRIAKSLYARGKPAWHALRAEFGPEVCGKGGHVDRKSLRRLVFGSAPARRRLDSVMFPLLSAELARRLRRGGKFCVDMAVYFKSPFPIPGARVVLVLAPLAQRVRRLAARYGTGAAQVLAMAKALSFGAGERRRSDLVLVNDASPGDMIRRLDQWLEEES